MFTLYIIKMIPHELTCLCMCSTERIQEQLAKWEAMIAKESTRSRRIREQLELFHSIGAEQLILPLLPEDEWHYGLWPTTREGELVFIEKTGTHEVRVVPIVREDEKRPFVVWDEDTGRVVVGCESELRSFPRPPRPTTCDMDL